MRRRLTLIYTFVLVLCAGSEKADNEDSIGYIINNFGKLNETQDNTLAESVNNFGFKLLKEMIKYNKDKNVIISPTGIAGLLAMTLLGTVGRSYDELADALGFSRDVRSNRQNHEQFGDLLKTLNDNGTSTTTYADAAFVDVGARLRDAYRSYLGRVYAGEAVSVDFADRDAVMTLINKWVSDHTNKKIEDFLKEPLPHDTRAVLLSALYFCGQWLKPFYPGHTKKLHFHKRDEDVLTEFMLNSGEFYYTFSIQNDLHMIALPYNDSTTTMYALLPRKPKEKSIQEVLETLDSNKIDRIIEEMTLTKCVLKLPRMDLQSTMPLERALKSIGIQSIFNPDRANFALMIDHDSVLNKTENELLTKINNDKIIETKLLNDIINSLPNPGIYIDTILHDVKININEYGTEAVAATAGILTRTAEMFYADTPFYMFIRNEKTKLVTFSAVINDPTA